jgi:hypothetical protein
MSDHRLSSRQRSLLRGVVYFADNPCAADCMVRDVSAAGARLEFAVPPAAVTDTLELQIPLKAQRHHCRVVWHAGRDIGVAFADANAMLPPQAVAERMDRLEAEIAQLKEMIRNLQPDESRKADVA